LVLLLQGSGYDARFLPLSSLSEAGSLEDVQLLLLTSELDAGRREARRASLDGAGAAEILTLELVVFAEGGREGGTRAWSERAVHWPCSTDELKQQIETAIFEKSGADRADRPGSFFACDSTAFATAQPEAPEGAV
jgi:hypothetical protein